MRVNRPGRLAGIDSLRMEPRSEVCPIMRDPLFASGSETFDAGDYGFIGLGSNLGDSSSMIRRAIERLAGFSPVPLLRSSLWKTEPVNCPEGSPPFLNAVVGIQPHSDETPESMLSKLLALEREFGRFPKQVANEPRVLDLDLIAFRNQTRDSPALRLPHPRAHSRRFVLEPLAEIAPSLILPGQIESVETLRQQIESKELVERLDGEF